MGVMMSVYGNSKHLEMKEVKFLSDVKEAEFIVEEDEERWRRICIDGDIITVQKGARIKIKVCDGVTVDDGSVLMIKCQS